jgi:large subunit ribosomal protein L15
MPIKLHNLKSKTPRKKKKLIGRGNASGHGTYSTRGIKGQKARSGVSGLKLKGMRHIILATPKLRGFRGLARKAATITLGQLDRCFKDNDVVDPRSLLKNSLVRRIDGNIKIVASGELTKKLTVRGCGVSAGAKTVIEKAGGKVG